MSGINETKERSKYMGESFYFHRHSESLVYFGDSLSQLTLKPGGSSNRSAADTKVKNPHAIKMLTQKWEKISDSIQETSLCCE